MYNAGYTSNSVHRASGSEQTSVTVHPRGLDISKVCSASSAIAPKHYVNTAGHSRDFAPVDERQRSRTVQNEGIINNENHSHGSNVGTAAHGTDEVSKITHLNSPSELSHFLPGRHSAAASCAGHTSTTAAEAAQCCVAGDTSLQVNRAPAQDRCAPEARQAGWAAVQVQKQHSFKPTPNTSCEVGTRRQQLPVQSTAVSGPHGYQNGAVRGMALSRLPLREAMKHNGCIFESSSAAESELAAALRVAGASDASARLQREHMTAALVMLASDSDLRQLLASTASLPGVCNRAQTAQPQLPAQLSGNISQNSVHAVVQLVRSVASRLCGAPSQPEKHEIRDALKSECLLMRALKARERYNTKLVDKLRAMQRSCVPNSDIQGSIMELEPPQQLQGRSVSMHNHQHHNPATGALHPPVSRPLGTASVQSTDRVWTSNCTAAAELSTMSSHTAQHAVQPIAAQGVKGTSASAALPVVSLPRSKTSNCQLKGASDPSLLRFLTGPGASKLRAASCVVPYCRSEELRSWRLCQGHFIRHRQLPIFMVSSGQDDPPKAKKLQGLHAKAAEQAHTDPELGVRLCTAILKGNTKYGSCLQVVQQNFQVEALDPAAVYDIDASGRLVVVSR